jgi:uridine phosphorylase
MAKPAIEVYGNKVLTVSFIYAPARQDVHVWRDIGKLRFDCESATLQSLAIVKLQSAAACVMWSREIGRYVWESTGKRASNSL